MAQRIGLLTGGGDVPGLNAFIKTLVYLMEEAGHEVVGLRRGWSSLIHIRHGDDPENDSWLMPLDRATTRLIDRSGGTVLHSSRLNPAMLTARQVPEHLEGYPKSPDGKTVDATDYVLETLEFLRLDAVVAVGGDGTLSFAKRLHGEGVKMIAVPKTMDNDVFGTDYCIGFSTAVSRAVRLINHLRTAAGSHERFLVVELFGRYSGEPCLLASYLASVDRALIAEVPYETDRVVDLLMADKRNNPSSYAVVTVSEGAHPVDAIPLESGEADAVGHRKLGGIGEVLADAIQARSGERTIYQPLGYLMRSGPPDALDQLVAKNFANLAARLLLDGKTGRLVAIQNGTYTAVPIEEIGTDVRRVDVDRFYDCSQYRPRIRDVMNLPLFLH